MAKCEKGFTPGGQRSILMKKQRRLWNSGRIEIDKGGRDSVKKHLIYSGKLLWVALALLGLSTVGGCGNRNQIPTETENLWGEGAAGAENAAGEEAAGAENAAWESLAGAENGTGEGFNGADFPAEEAAAEAEDGYAEAEHIAALYRDLYDRAMEADTLGSLESLQAIVGRLGENGYAAVDSENQVDMTGAERAEVFCKAVEAGESGELTVVVVASGGGFRKYDFRTEDGKVDIVRGYYQYGLEGRLEERSIVGYTASFWEYTEDGYLLFSGSYYTEEGYILTLNDTPESAALRVRPLDAKCRALNRQYIMPVGYGRNNLFLTDWSGEDLGSLDFYDLFDRLYPVCYGRAVPYGGPGGSDREASRRVPEQEFEEVIMGFIPVRTETLRARTVYFPEEHSYGYRPRGFEEAEYPEIPYPEVVDYTEREDGTILLTVQAVYPYENTSRAFSHEVVVRPGEGGSFTYVSNKMLTPVEDCDLWWHTDRLTREEWEEKEREENDAEGGSGMDADRESTIGGGPSGSEKAREEMQGGSFTEKEKRELERQALEAMETVEDVYRIGEEGDSSEDITEKEGFSWERCREITILLGRAGYVSVSHEADMENYEKVEDFYAAYLEDRAAAVTVYNVNPDGGLGATTFMYRSGVLQAYYVETEWSREGRAEIRTAYANPLKEIRLTEKGYFIYACENVPAHANPCQYWRIKPLSKKCRELTGKYVFGLRYEGYPLLTTDWDESNVEEILEPCMFGDIYHIVTGEPLELTDGRIPADLFEEVMTTCLPVTIEQLRIKCGYDPDTRSYPYEMIYPSLCAPFGEVVDYRDNEDGTIRLFVDGVWPDYFTDCAFRTCIVVQAFSDGTFRYLSNRQS